MKARPHLYLDTCIILDAIYNRRRQTSNVLLARAKEEVEQGNWLCSTSRWTMLELFDNMQEELFVTSLRIEGNVWSNISRKLHTRRQKEAGLKKPDLDSIWRRLQELITKDYSFIQFKYPKDVAMWDKAEDYCGGTNIGSTDAIHLASALEIGCNILVTTDQDFLPIANNYIISVLPENIDNGLNDPRYPVKIVTYRVFSKGNIQIASIPEHDPTRPLIRMGDKIPLAIEKKDALYTVIKVGEPHIGTGNKLTVDLSIDDFFPSITQQHFKGK
jgi:predicted nucleic acid-binding protein